MNGNNNFPRIQFWISVSVFVMSVAAGLVTITRAGTSLEAQVVAAREEFRTGLRHLNERLADVTQELREHNRDQDDSIKQLRELHLREGRRGGSIQKPVPDIGG